ncbi:carbon monoxide dehydrogenase [Verticiella sediminum]|uniref:Carbon monoxide dehydrogenase n=1 Tax=Verticiella sediminum TaxID=1247510 RepID=A0A556A6G0_9BURK|nr:FAD binding domain-containing protein [Verticiella sediminum]TSH88481.1 carbon monoxide dehydrogenase [Verticiella sediminum]
MKAAAYRLHSAANLADARALLAEDEFNKPIAGGQSLGAMLNLRLARPGSLVDLDPLAELRRAAIVGDALELGAMVTHAAIEDGAVPDATAGMLAHVARGIAYRAVRNRGTIGGSLCHADPAADWICSLPALGAQAIVEGPDGRREVPVGQFIRSAFDPDLAPGEILVAVRVPALSTDAAWGYRKFCRKRGEFASAIVAGVRDSARGVERLVFGALDGAPVVLEMPGLYECDPAALVGTVAEQCSASQRGLYADLTAQVLADIQGRPRRTDRQETDA